MSSLPRELFTVDLRGLRAKLRARAASNGLAESTVLRMALAVALGTDERDPGWPSAGTDRPIRADHIKLSVRLARDGAARLDHNARAAGVSRGVYLARLIDGAPPVVASSDRAAMCNALSASTAELALLSRDINQLTQLLRQGSVQAARVYTTRHETLDADVRRHLALAAPVLAELSSLCLAAKQRDVSRRPRAHGELRSGH